MVPFILKRIRKAFSKSDYEINHVYPSVFLHGKRRLPPDRFSLNTLFEIFGKVCRHTQILVVKGHTTRRPTYVYDISLLFIGINEPTFSMRCEKMSKRKVDDLNKDTQIGTRNTASHRS